MTEKKKVELIIKTLEDFFPNPLIPLNHKDPYTLLVGVVLSARSTDKKVNEVTPILFSKADNPYDMAKLKVEEIKDIIKPVGLSPMKSKGIHGLSRILIDKYNGRVPESLEALEELPSVGHKTASVVVSQAFGIPAFPVDTHVHRMLFRWKLSNGKSVTQTEKDAKRLFPKELWNKLHLQIIYYARAYSPSQKWNKEKDVIFNLIN